jgi:hypothetical protein
LGAPKTQLAIAEKYLRHAFSFPAHIREAVRAYVRRAIEEVSPRRFAQEPSYTAALLARLDGTPYDEADGSVVITATNVNSVGPGAAERWSGADFAITATITKGDVSIKKAILAQAKLGGLAELTVRERERMVGQIVDMRSFTQSPKVMLIHEIGERREPIMTSGTRIAKNLDTQELSLPDYFVRRILTTLDGDTRPVFVAGVEESTLQQLRVYARTRPTE